MILTIKPLFIHEVFEPKIKHMKYQEFVRLRTLELSLRRRNRPAKHVTSRRSAKAVGTGTGQVLKQSRVVPQVNVERVFITSH